MKNFEKAELVELDAPKIERFIERFYEEVAKRNPDFAGLKADRIAKLKLAVQREELHELAANPFMLTVMAWLHRFEELPRKRASILNRLVEMLLFKWEEVKQRDDPAPEVPKLSELLKQHDLEVTSLRRVLCRLAYQARQAVPPPSGEQRTQPAVRISKTNLLSAVAELPDADKHAKDSREQWALQVIQVIDRRTGVLVPEGGDSFTMPYKLQEFLAGEHLTNRDELETVGKELGLILDKYNFDRVVAQLVGENGYWEEVVKWAAAIQAHLKGNPSEARNLALELCVADPASNTAQVRRAVVAGEILWEVGLQEVKNTHRTHGPDCLKKVRETLDNLTTQKSLAPKQRAAAAATRGWLEDLPCGVGLKDRLPDLDWIEIPAGNFQMGGTESWQGGREFKCSLIKQSYKISRYPVTVAQYQAFVEDKGYAEKRFWTQAGWEWRTSQNVMGPEDYDLVFQTPNHPRVGVSWFEAVAFCRWLTERLRNLPESSSRREEALTEKADSGKAEKQKQIGASLPRLLPDEEICLPSEAEWERAARGENGRPYSWGDATNFAERCNCARTEINHTSAVGLFPSGDTTPLEPPNKTGVADMTGNVWEWCRTLYMPNYNNYEKKVSDEPEGEDTRVLRGGSWVDDNPRDLLASFRNDVRPDGRGTDVGFRVVCACVSAR